MRSTGGRCRHVAAIFIAVALLALPAACSTAEPQPTVLPPTPTADASSVAASATSDPEPSESSADPASPAPAPSTTVVPPPAGSSTDEENAVPSAPTLAGEAAELTRAGAADFAAYFTRVIDYAYLTGDTALLSAGSLDECLACETAEANIEETYAAGGRYEGELTRIHAAVSPTIEPKEQAEAFVLFTAPVLIETNATGEQVGSIPEAMNARVRFDLEWQGGRWMVANIVDQESS